MSNSARSSSRLQVSPAAGAEGRGLRAALANGGGEGARSSPPAPALVETRERLVERATRRFGAVAAAALVEHLLAQGPEGDWVVHEAALDALVRRYRFAVADGLAVSARPAGGAVLGHYETARGGRARATEARPARSLEAGGSSGRSSRRTRRPAAEQARPYVVRLDGVEPLAGSCDCPDYLKSSLGLCKHLLVVLDHVFQSERKLAKARREQGQGRSSGELLWDPRLSLRGPHDRLAGLRFVLPAASTGDEGALRAGKGTRGRASAARSSSRTARVEPEGLTIVRKAFAQGAPKASWLSQPKRRRELLAALAALTGSAPDAAEAGRKAGSRRGAGARQRALRARGGGASPVEASPAAAALVRDELERVDRRLENQRCLASTLRPLRSLRRKLYPYQREGVERFLAAGRLLLADDMGLGKTTQAIAACHALFEAGRVRRGLVIVPASLKGQWLREWQATTDVPAAVVEGAPPERLEAYRGLKRGFLILNYELLLRDGEAIHALGAEMVVLDEAQRIKNYATKSAASVKALAPEYRLVLTGTPMENRLEELASLLDWVDDVALAPKWRLVPGYTRGLGDGGGSPGSGARNLESLRQRLAPCLLRRVRREVLAQLPPRKDTRVPVAMTPQQAEEHAALVRPIAALLRVTRRRPLTHAEFLKLMQLLNRQRMICNGLGQLHFEELWPSYSGSRANATLLEGLFSPKLLELRRLIADLVLDQGRKVVVFSQWRRMLRLAEWSVRALLSDAGLESRFFTGAEKPQQRTRSVVDFHDDPRVATLFLSDAGGVGLNLQRAASACINLELPWNPAVIEQRIGRIYRLGQKRPIDVYNLVSESGIEARIAGLLGTKQALFSELFDGTSNDLRFDEPGSFLSRVERLVEGAPAATAAGAGAPTFEGAEPSDDEERDPDEDELGGEPDEPSPRDDRRARGERGEAGGDGGDGDGEAAAPAEGLASGGNAAGESRHEDASGQRRAEGAAVESRASGEGASNAEGVAARNAHAPSAGDAQAPVRSAADSAALLSSLRVERTPSGGVRIEAPPEAVGTLVALFQGMAQLIGAGLGDAGRREG